MANQCLMLTVVYAMVTNHTYCSLLAGDQGSHIGNDMCIDCSTDSVGTWVVRKMLLAPYIGDISQWFNIHLIRGNLYDHNQCGTGLCNSSGYDQWSRGTVIAICDGYALDYDVQWEYIAPFYWIRFLRGIIRRFISWRSPIVKSQPSRGGAKEPSRIC